MKRLTIEKSAETGSVTAEQLAGINRFARRPLAAEDVFVFSVILCDNEVDRDLECFPAASLETLGSLFVGKTGVFDHNPQAKNQSARIFETALIREERLTAQGEPYCALKAWAYMLRSEKNSDLVREIDAGIKKEVSVGCAVDKITCSICGKDRRKESCAHEKGKSYAGKLCYHLLEEPADAYEWSFVAVPAQKNAGVTKKLGEGDPILLEKWVESGENAPLTRAQAESLRAQCKALHSLAQAGEAYLGGLRKEVARLALLSHPSLSPAAMESLTRDMSLTQLQEFRKAFADTAARRYPVRPQLGGAPADAREDLNSDFKI